MMEFIHEPYIPGDTIAAIATPIGDGGMIERISIFAIEVPRRLFLLSLDYYIVDLREDLRCRKQPDRRCPLTGHERKKRSFTGEDTVEVHCHGGRLITKKVLQTILQRGREPPSPVNSPSAPLSMEKSTWPSRSRSRINFSQKRARPERGGRAAAGALSKKIADFQRQLTEICRYFRGRGHFPEEGLEFITTEELIGVYKAFAKKCANWRPFTMDG